MIVPRRPGRVIALALLFLASAAVVALDAAEPVPSLERTVVVTGEDLFVLRAPEPAGWGEVALPALDLGLPAAAREPPLAPPSPPPIAPPPRQVLALMEAPDA